MQWLLCSICSRILKKHLNKCKHKTLQLHLISYCGSFVERLGFRRPLNKSLKNVRSHKMPSRENQLTWKKLTWKNWVKSTWLNTWPTILIEYFVYILKGERFRRVVLFLCFSYELVLNISRIYVQAVNHITVDLSPFQ